MDETVTSPGVQMIKRSVNRFIRLMLDERRRAVRASIRDLEKSRNPEFTRTINYTSFETLLISRDPEYQEEFTVRGIEIRHGAVHDLGYLGRLNPAGERIPEREPS